MHFTARCSAVPASLHTACRFVRHCTACCLLARKCPEWDVLILGRTKEFLDGLGLGNREEADLVANKNGVILSRHVEFPYQCREWCEDLYN